MKIVFAEFQKYFADCFYVYIEYDNTDVDYLDRVCIAYLNCNAKNKFCFLLAKTIFGLGLWGWGVDQLLAL